MAICRRCLCSNSWVRSREADLAAYFASRKTPPRWLWAVAAGGTASALLLLIAAVALAGER